MFALILFLFNLVLNITLSLFEFSFNLMTFPPVSENKELEKLLWLLLKLGKFSCCENDMFGNEEPIF